MMSLPVLRVRHHGVIGGRDGDVLVCTSVGPAGEVVAVWTAPEGLGAVTSATVSAAGARFPDPAAARPVEARITVHTPELAAVTPIADLPRADRRPQARHPARREDRVFRLFQRLGDRDNHTGVGLGLALARGLTEAMNGTLVPDDTPGGGLTMILTLPAAPAPAAPGAGDAMPGTRPPAQRSPTLSPAGVSPPGAESPHNPPVSRITRPQ